MRREAARLSTNQSVSSSKSNRNVRQAARPTSMAAPSGTTSTTEGRRMEPANADLLPG